MKFNKYEFDFKDQIKINEAGVKIIATRPDTNSKLTIILTELIKRHPELRFGQILYNFGFITKPLKEGEAPQLFDPFNEEPIITFKRVCAELERLGYNNILELVND
jgi:hypothetical protein